MCKCLCFCSGNGELYIRVCYGVCVLFIFYVLGGQSIYGGVFPDEFHSRLRFKHRGLVACANASSPNSNGSQFFMTLDRCDWLDKKHTIFGKVMVILRMKISFSRKIAWKL